MRTALAGLLLFASTGWSQRGQEGPRPGWPCVPGRAVDPSYLEISESTGGQLFLFQKGEVQHSGVMMSASITHPATVLRAVGQLAGTREFAFPVDSTVESILVMASLQCRKEIAILRPDGGELTAANTAQSIDLQAGKILRVELPEAGSWRVRVSGTGLFVLSVLARSPLRLGNVTVENSAMTATVIGEVAGVSFHLAGPGGEELAAAAGSPELADGLYRMPVTPSQERFRVVMRGVDGNGRPVQRTHPVLFRASPK